MGTTVIVAVRADMAITCITGIITITAILVILAILAFVSYKVNVIWKRQKLKSIQPFKNVLKVILTIKLSKIIREIINILLPPNTKFKDMEPYCNNYSHYRH